MIPELPFVLQDLSTFKGNDLFLKNYQQTFPTNPFGVKWTTPFEYQWFVYGACWVVPIYWFDRTPVAYYCREIFGKKKIVIHKDYQFWYGMDLFFSGWTPDKPIILVEGPKDRISVSRFYPWTQALLGSTLGGNRLEVFCSIVKKVVLFLDGDQTGKESTAHLTARLIERHVQVQNLSLHNAKDPGAFMEDMFYASSVLGAQISRI